MEIHPMADIFPMMSEDELDALAADIKKNGLREPILVHKKTKRVVDGRNRLEAAKRAKVEPITKEVDGDPLDLVLSYNVKRRHMKSGQLAVVAAEAWGLAIQEGKAKPDRGGDQRKKFAIARPAEHFADLFGSNRKYVQDARALVKDAPDLARSVKSGDKTLTEAVEQFKQRQQEQREQEKRKEQEKGDRDALRQDHPDLFEQVEAGKLPLAEALRQGRIRDSVRKNRASKVTERFVGGLVRLRGVDRDQLLQLYDRGVAANMIADWGGAPGGLALGFGLDGARRGGPC
jgi:hypothetical protein